MRFKIKYINHKGFTQKATLRGAVSKKAAIKFVRLYIGKPIGIRELK